MKNEISAQELSVQELSDRAQISDLLARYCRAIDTRDYNLLDTCFTEDSVIDITGLNGPVDKYPQVRDWLERSLQGLSAMQHSISNMEFDIDGDDANVCTMFINTNVINKADGSDLVFTVGGFYHDKIQRTADGWRIVYRNETQTYFVGDNPNALG